MMEETGCFICSRTTGNIYRDHGVPLCSTCNSNRQNDTKKSFNYCDRCSISSDGSIVLYTPYGKLCSTCRSSLARVEIPYRESILRRNINSTIEKVYRSGRADDYHVESSNLPIVQTILHSALILILLTTAFFTQNPVQIAAELVVAILLILLLLSFLTLKIKIYNNEIRCVYGPFTYAIRKEDIEQVEIIEPENYLAYGMTIRRNKYGWLLKFIRGNGPGILIKKKSGFFRSIYVSSMDPVNLLQKMAMKMT